MNDDSVRSVSLQFQFVFSSYLSNIKCHSWLWGYYFARKCAWLWNRIFLQQMIWERNATGISIKRRVKRESISRMYYCCSLCLFFTWFYNVRFNPPDITRRSMQWDCAVWEHALPLTSIKERNQTDESQVYLWLRNLSLVWMGCEGIIWRDWDELAPYGHICTGNYGGCVAGIPADGGLKWLIT